ncbi:MAG: ABC transporter permease [Gemmatimonadales bacterium]
MRRTIAARLLQSVVVVFIVTTITFFVIRLAPGDPFSYDSTAVTPAVRAHWRAQFGYDRPLVVQYVRYLASIAHGQFGYSFERHEPVAAALRETIPNTLLLAGLALGASFIIGIIVGVLQAVHRGRWFDRVSSTVLLTLYSLPDFWGALMMLLLFSYWWRLLPAGGSVDPVMHDYLPAGRALLDRLAHLVLPAASLTLLSAAAVARYQRSAMLDALPSDYVRTARAKGVPEHEVVWRHALRTAITPMIVLLGLLLPALLGGTVFVEKVFSWPGIGYLAVSAIDARDYDVVTATVVVGSVLVVIGNLLADLLHMAVDPRVRA